MAVHNVFIPTLVIRDTSYPLDVDTHVLGIYETMRDAIRNTIHLLVDLGHFNKNTYMENLRDDDDKSDELEALEALQEQMDEEDYEWKDEDEEEVCKKKENRIFAEYIINTHFPLYRRGDVLDQLDAVCQLYGEIPMSRRTGYNISWTVRVEEQFFMP